MVRADIDAPVIEGGLAKTSDLAIAAETRQRMVAYVRREDVAPEAEDAAVGLRQQCDSTTLATMLGDLVVPAKGNAAVVGNCVINGGPGVIGCLAACGHPVALVDPRDDELAAAGHGHRMESMRECPGDAHERLRAALKTSCRRP